MSATATLVEAPRAVTLHAARDRVDVWLVELTRADGEAALRTLSEPERRHAARLRTDAAHWVAARAALRSILARYLGVAPRGVALETGASGKPRLASGASVDLRFNLSHSGSAALIAVRLGHEVGIDMEELRSGVDGAAIARDLFTADERTALADRGAGIEPTDFFRAWVRREALAKASGRGITAPPPAEGTARYVVRHLDGVPGFAVALASEGCSWSVRIVLA